MAESILDTLQIAPANGMADYLASREPAKAPTVPEPQAAEPVAETVAEPVAAATEAEPVTEAEPFEDPETHEVVAKPTRGHKRIKRLWQEREDEKRARVAAEQRAADLEAQLAGRAVAPSTERQPTTPTDSAAQALTAAAQARIRPKPDRALIGSTYAQYEDYVEDCAIWGGELAAAKREVQQETQAAEQAQAQRIETLSRSQAEAAQMYPDYHEVVRQNLPLTQPMVDVILDSPNGGHLMYYLGTHPAEAARIARLAPGPALVAMGELRASVSAAQAPPAATSEPEAPSKPSAAPRPLRPVARPAATSTALEDVKDPMQWIRERNARERSRGRSLG